MEMSLNNNKDILINIEIFKLIFWWVIYCKFFSDFIRKRLHEAALYKI